ncbi:SDR family oxidoreductase [Streptomyces sp. NPDC004393]|uniref:SDR family oxidoreductase n=1 Tax=Streptomyces sp. NPDC004533 TaxID=3154278 RepID=UPI0033B962DB
MPLCCHLVVPGMRARGGESITLIGAAGTETGGAPGLAERAVVKSAQDTLGRALARKLGPDGIRVNTVAAGLVPTDANVGEHQASWIRRVGVRDTAGTGPRPRTSPRWSPFWPTTPPSRSPGHDSAAGCVIKGVGL